MEGEPGFRAAAVLRPSKEAATTESRNDASNNAHSTPVKSPVLPLETQHENNLDSVEEDRLLKVMRDSVVKLNPDTKDVDDVTLRRFLRARQKKVDKATDMFMEHYQWRKTYVPLGYVPEEEIPNELGAKKVFLQGKDKLGRPIGVIQASKHDAYKRNLEEFKKYCVYNFDKCVARVSSVIDQCFPACFSPLPAEYQYFKYTQVETGKYLADSWRSMNIGEEKFSVIVDLHGLQYKNLDPRAWTVCFDYLQAHYPERIGKIYLIHVPYVFWGAWKIVSKFIDKRTRDKIIIVDDKHLDTVLLKEIDREQLPKFCGGELDLVLIQDALTPNWPPNKASLAEHP